LEKGKESIAPEAKHKPSNEYQPKPKREFIGKPGQWKCGIKIKGSDYYGEYVLTTYSTIKSKLIPV
jgi:hypothetical protein